MSGEYPAYGDEEVLELSVGGMSPLATALCWLLGLFYFVGAVGGVWYLIDRL